MQTQGLSTEEEIEKEVDKLYEIFCAEMNEDDIRKLNSFGEQYLALPAGYDSFAVVYPIKLSAQVGEMDQKYLHYASAIDNVVRPLFNKFVYSTRSESECKKYLLCRLLITSVSFCCGCILPGGGVLGVYCALYDMLDAAIMYKNSLRTRGGE